MVQLLHHGTVHRGDPTREGLRRLHIDGIVQRHERLQGSVRTFAPHRANFPARRIERNHRRIGIRPPPRGIKTAPVAIFARAVLPIQRAPEGGAHPHFWLRRIHGRSVHFTAKQPAHRERLIADHFRRETKTRAPRQQSVVRVVRQCFRRDPRRLAISRRHHHQLEQVFHIPAAFAEFHGQPIQQLRMRGRIALTTEIFTRADDTGTKNRFPKQIRDDPRHQRVLRVRQPSREPEPIRRSALGQRMQRSRSARRDFLAKVEVISAALNVGLAHFAGRHFGHHRHRRVGLDRSQLFHHRREPRPLCRQARRDRHVVRGGDFALFFRAFGRWHLDRRQHGSRRARNLGGPWIDRRGQPKRGERVVLFRRQLLDRHRQLGPRRQRHRPLREQHHGMRAAALWTDRPTFFFPCPHIQN